MTTKASILVLNMLMLILVCHTAWGGAAGNVTITFPPAGQSYRTVGGLTVQGTYIMTQDSGMTGSLAPGDPRNICCCGESATLSPYYLDSAYAEKTYANCLYSIDGNGSGGCGTIYGGGDWTQLDVPQGFSAPISISGLAKNTSHTVTVYLQEVYSAWCPRQADAYGISGSVFAQDSTSFYIPTQCDVAINNFSGNNNILTFGSGNNVAFSGSMVENFGNPISWSISIGKTGVIASGSGPSISGASWNGSFVSPGTYTATLTATSAPDCTAISTFNVTVYKPKGCTSVQTNSSADLISGGLTHSQTLFTVPNGKPVSDFVLYYNSADGYPSLMGTGWRHSYDIYIQQNIDGSYSYFDGKGLETVLYKNGASYTPVNYAYPVLLKNSGSSFTLTQKDGTMLNFDQTGRCTGIQDRNTNTLILGYGANGSLSSITDSYGRVISLQYDTYNRISTITDLNGNTHNFTYGGNFLVAVTTNTADNHVRKWAYTYDTNGNMLTKTDPAGFVVTYTYDSNGRYLSSTDPEGGIRSLSYNGSASTSTFTEKDGGVWTYIYGQTRSCQVFS